MKRFLFFAFFLVFVISASGQKYIKYCSDSVRMKYAVFEPTETADMRVEDFFKFYLHLDKPNQLVPTDTFYSPDSLYYHIKYKQYYADYYVENSTITLTYHHNSIIRFKGNYLPIKSLVTQTIFNTDDAVERYKDYYGTENDSCLFIVETPIIEDTSLPSKAVLSFKIQSSNPNLADKILYVSAYDLSFIKEEKAPSSSFNATLYTKYNGIRQGNHIGSDSAFVLSDYSAAVQLLKIDSGVTNIGTGIPNTFYNKTDIWNNYSDTTYPQHILDAYWASCLFSYYLQNTYQYPKHYFQRWWNPYIQQYMVDDTMTYVYVALDTYVDNTMWKRQLYQSQFKAPGHDLYKNIIIIGAPGQCHYPKASIDEVVHEYAHIFSYQSWSPHLSSMPDYILDNRLAEACADIWAAILTSKIYPEEENKIWKIGEDVVLPSSGDSCIRNLANPSDPFAETEMNSNACQEQDGNAYKQSGVISHWFYILTHGYDGMNCTGVCCYFSGIPIDSAAKLLYYCETAGYFVKEMSYSDICQATIDATENFSDSETMRNSVIKAWLAVGVKPENIGIEQYGLDYNSDNTGNYYVDGDLIVEPLMTLTIKGSVFLSNNSTIVISPGGKLIVDGGTLTSACAGEMWQGIEVVGNRTQHQNAAHQGTVILRNKAVIENAHCAIRTGLGGRWT